MERELLREIGTTERGRTGPRGQARDTLVTTRLRSDVYLSQQARVMSALASLAAYGDDDDGPGVEQSQPAKEGDASSSCPAGEPTLAANGAQPAPASSNPPPPDMSDTAPPPAARPFAGPSSPIAPSRTPSSRTSSLAHLLPPPPLAHTETNPAIEVRASPPPTYLY